MNLSLIVFQVILGFAQALELTALLKLYSLKDLPVFQLNIPVHICVLAFQALLQLVQHLHIQRINKESTEMLKF